MRTADDRRRTFEAWYERGPGTPLRDVSWTGLFRPSNVTIKRRLRPSNTIVYVLLRPPRTQRNRPTGCGHIGRVRSHPGCVAGRARKPDPVRKTELPDRIGQDHVLQRSADHDGRP